MRFSLEKWFTCSNLLPLNEYCHLQDSLPIYPPGLCKSYACDTPVSQTATNSDECQPDPLYIYKGIPDMTVSNCGLHVNIQIVFFNEKSIFQAHVQSVN